MHCVCALRHGGSERNRNERNRNERNRNERNRGLDMSFKNVEVKKQANVFHNGRVTSRTVITISGQRKTLGIMLRGTYRFTPDVPERIDVTQGKCKVRVGREAI